MMSADHSPNCGQVTVSFRPHEPQNFACCGLTVLQNEQVRVKSDPPQLWQNLFDAGLAIPQLLQNTTFG
jgi:hypothetical protein